MAFPRMVNRDALIVRPKAPFFAWAASVFDMKPADVEQELEGGVSVWLIEESPSGALEDAFVRKIYQHIFEEVLLGWCNDPDAWPGNRSFDLFNAWFDLDYQPWLYDLAHRTLKRE